MRVTPLRPIEEDRSARGVSSERYPLNKICAHPECREPVADPHHTFARSQIGNDSWFVQVLPVDPVGDEQWVPGENVFPHVTGLCRTHHDTVEQHRAWIKLEEQTFVWYDRTDYNGDDEGLFWNKVGPLNPQPGSVEGRPKRARKRHQGEARRKRATVSLRVPDDAQEDGAGLLDEAIERVEDLLYPDRPEGEKRRPAYFTLMDALEIAAIELQNPGRDE